MKFIQVTNLSGDPIFINPQHIGHMYEVKEKIEYGKVSKPKHTRLGVVTHNNGGFEVKETPQEIMKKIIS
jgi:uncharacterized protein YlzI (FlbEa/FlbD family)